MCVWCVGVRPEFARQPLTPRLRLGLFVLSIITTTHSCCPQPHSRCPHSRCPHSRCPHIPTVLPLPSCPLALQAALTLPCPHSRFPQSINLMLEIGKRSAHKTRRSTFRCKMRTAQKRVVNVKYFKTSFLYHVLVQQANFLFDHPFYNFSRASPNKAQAGNYRSIYIGVLILHMQVSPTSSCDRVEFVRNP